MTDRQLPLRGVTFVNGGAGGEVLRMQGSRITAAAGASAGSDLVVDLHGDRVLPGLINAHDHLQLNTLPPLESNKRYGHAHEWIRDVDSRRRTDAAFEALVAEPQNDRLLIGGMKNLLSGVTTVAHHDPLYPFTMAAAFPVRVPADFGWSHSLYIDGEAQVRDSHARTSPDCPWIIHAAEGCDAESAGEFDKLEELGCVRANTLIVHGISLDADRRRRLERAAAGLIWCPASNLRLFARTAEVKELIKRGRVALGTDSRLSGARDLLEELRVAREVAGLSEAQIEAVVTRHSAALLRLRDRGSLATGSLADFIILPAGMPLSQASRTDIRLVVRDGIPRYADEMYADQLAPPSFWAQVSVDGRSKMLERELVSALAAAQSCEPGLEIADITRRAA